MTTRIADVGISRGWDPRFKRSYVSVQVYGDRDGNAYTPEQVGAAFGALRRAADAALEIDPWADFIWKKSERAAEPREDGGKFRATMSLGLAVRASSGDVMEGGPIHRARESELAEAMRRGLDEAIPMRSLT